MAQTTTSDLNSLYPLIYEDALFVAREMNLMAQLVFNYAGGTMAARYVGIRPQVSATAKAEGADFANPTTFGISSNATFTPSTVMAQVILTDEDIMTDPSDARMSAARELGGAIATKVDQDLVGLFSSFSSSKGAAATTLTLAYCAAAIAKLTSEKAPAPINVVLHPFQWHDVWLELGSPAATYTFLGDVANEALRNYAVGNFVGAQWYRSSNITPDADDDAYGAAFHRESLGLDTRQSPAIEIERDASKKAWEFNMSMMYGVAIRRDAFGVAILSDAAEPTGA